MSSRRPAHPAGGAERGLTVGAEVEVDVTAFAHGGHAIARYEGQVLFVRHALPGERVRARVGEIGPGGRYVRADAVEVTVASSDRVRPPCPWAGPNRCGGCDLQHVSLPGQRTLKAGVVREQFARLAGLEVEVEVEPVAGDTGGLDWRTRVEFAVDEEGRAGLRRHRSHHIVPVDHCRIAAPGIDRLRVPDRAWPGLGAVDAVAPSVGEPVTVRVPDDGGGPVVRERVTASWRADDGREVAFDREFGVASRGFWQVHPGAAGTFLGAAMTALGVRPGERALDLYAGVGLFAAALGAAVGPSGQVVAVESDPTAADHARANLVDQPHVAVVTARVDDAFGVSRGSRRGGPPRGARSPLLPPWVDVVVLDPPRAGAGRAVCVEVSRLRPRAIAYLGCDPAVLARDTAVLAGVGYRLDRLRAFDAFPMTHHVECLAMFRAE
jgi:tRNA/tmRNA/rRNA uracil-C5-methylase (TrmA/RlmC/RlmD family)